MPEPRLGYIPIVRAGLSLVMVNGPSRQSAGKQPGRGGTKARECTRLASYMRVTHRKMDRRAGPRWRSPRKGGKKKRQRERELGKHSHGAQTRPLVFFPSSSFSRGLECELVSRQVRRGARADFHPSRRSNLQLVGPRRKYAWMRVSGSFIGAWTRELLSSVCLLVECIGQRVYFEFCCVWEKLMCSVAAEILAIYRGTYSSAP